MKIIILMMMMLFQAQAQDSLTVVAVGEAEIEKDSLIIAKPKVSFKASPKIFQEIKEIGEILKSDFSFYKHKFSLEKPSDGKPTYNIKLEFKSFNSVSVEVINNMNSVRSSSFNVPVDARNIITTAHTVSNKIYEAIAGEKSIFLSKIVFVSDRVSTRKEIRKELYIMDFDGRRKQRLTYTNSMIISPAISPDNSKILYSAIENKWKRSSRGAVIKVKNINLYLLDLKTKKTTLISEVDGMNSGAVFSADGKDIFLTLTHTKNADIYKINLKTKKRTKITSHFLDDVDPHINKDGNLLTFLSGRSGRAMIYTLDPTGVEKSVKRISYVGKFNAAPKFSPDGSQITFSSWVDDKFDIYKIDSNGQNLVRLTKNFGSNEEANFSPDGQFIVFSSQKVINRKKAIQNIYIMNVEGEIIKKVSSNYGKIFTPRWSN